jgi:hypothetical protein
MSNGSLGILLPEPNGLPATLDQLASSARGAVKRPLALSRLGVGRWCGMRGQNKKRCYQQHGRRARAGPNSGGLAELHPRF